MPLFTPQVSDRSSYTIGNGQLVPHSVSVWFCVIIMGIALMAKDLFLDTLPMVSSSPCRRVCTEYKLEKAGATLFAEGVVWLAHNPKRGL